MEKELVTRKQLYDLVWSTPLTTLAKKYGLSDNGLRKICNKFNVPLPAAGHWMKLQFNKKVQIIPLPIITEDEVTITLALTDMEAKDQKQERFKEIKITLPPISVPQRLTQPDPLIVQAKQSLLDKEASRSFRQNDMVQSRNGELDIAVTLKNVNRALCFMDALIKAFYKRGYQILFRNGFTYVEVKDQEFRIAFREKTKRVVIPGKSWNSSEYHPTGILYFKYDGYGNKEWKDGQKPLETRIPDIIAKLEMISADLTAAQENNRRRWEEIKRKEQEVKNLWEKKQKELEDFKLLLKKADRWQKSTMLRNYIDAVEKHANENGISQDMQQWLQWSRKKADWYDPFIEAEDDLLKEVHRTKLVFK